MSKITRRDFINGSLVLGAASMLSFGRTIQTVFGKLDPLYYPPALTGLRGNHIGSNTHAHAKALDKNSNWGRITKLREEYELIVVGGGISGLSAAFFYQQLHGRDKKILILDNHDDFGGHAKRNEHKVGDNTRLIFGGSQSVVSPHVRSETTLKLLGDLGIDLGRFKRAYDLEFYKRNNLRAVTFFNNSRFA